MSQYRIPNVSDIDFYNEFVASFHKESDRGAALIGGELLSSKLEELLRAHFVESSKNYAKLLMGVNGPLGTFSSKIDVAFALGLINERDYTELTIIRKIRNAFEHQLQAEHFTEQHIKNQCLNLSIVADIKESGLLDIDNWNQPRTQYLWAIGIIYKHLMSYIGSQSHCTTPVSYPVRFLKETFLLDNDYSPIDVFAIPKNTEIIVIE